MATYEQLKFKVLWKLYHHRYWGAKHIDIRDIPKGLPSHEISACLDVVHDLVRKGWLVKKKTKRGDRVFLNPRKGKEIKQFLEKFESF